MQFKTFQPIALDQELHEESEEDKVRKVFPEKIIFLVGGIEKILKMPDADKYSSISERQVFKHGCSRSINAQSMCFHFLNQRAYNLWSFFPVTLTKEETQGDWGILYPFDDKRNCFSVFERAKYPEYKKVFCGEKECIITSGYGRRLHLRLPKLFENTMIRWLVSDRTFDEDAAIQTPLSYGLSKKISPNFIGMPCEIEPATED